MRKNRFLDILSSIIIILIIGILGFTFYVVFMPEEEEKTLTYAEVNSLSVRFDLNGADYIERKSANCESLESCEIILPSATRRNGEVLGYDTSPVSTNPKYKIGDTYQVVENITLYVISSIERKITIDRSKVDYLENSLLSCKAFNKEQSCIVRLPVFNKVGYENRGYSTSDTSIVGFAFPNEKYKISKDVTLYPIYRTNNHLVNLKIDKVLFYNDSIIEIENGCGEDVYSQYLDYIKEIQSYAPYLLITNKISFVSDDSFDSIWGGQYVGMNYGPYSSRSLDVRCSYRIYNDYYGTMVHEMSHSWDFLYGSRMNGNLSSQSDIINLYNKYLVMDNRPFRDYSYSSIYEFLADSMKYYYFKYLVPKNGYRELDFPKDIRSTLEKYICIAKNDYNEEGCV